MMQMGFGTPKRMSSFSPVPTDLRNKFEALRAGSEPNDLFNDKGLRRCSFPIKLAGITMGSQENLASGTSDDESGEFFEHFRRRSRRNSLSFNPSLVGQSEKKVETTKPATPFGPVGIPNGKSRRPPWSQRRMANSVERSMGNSSKSLSERLTINGISDQSQVSESNVAEISSLLNEMKSDIEALGNSTKKLIDSDYKELTKVSSTNPTLVNGFHDVTNGFSKHSQVELSGSNSFESEVAKMNKIETKMSETEKLESKMSETFELQSMTSGINKFESKMSETKKLESKLTEMNNLEVKMSETKKFESQKSNKLFRSSFKVDEASNDSNYVRNSNTPDELPRLASVSPAGNVARDNRCRSPRRDENGLNHQNESSFRVSEVKNLETSSTVSVEETVFIHVPLKRTSHGYLATPKKESNEQMSKPKNIDAPWSQKMNDETTLKEFKNSSLVSAEKVSTNSLEVDFRPYSSISITSDVIEVDDEEVVYHSPNQRPVDADDVIEVQPDQVNYKCRRPEQAILITKDDGEKFCIKTERASLADLILSPEESEALEKLFDKLVVQSPNPSEANTIESITRPSRSQTQLSIRSDVDVEVDAEDESSDAELFERQKSPKARTKLRTEGFSRNRSISPFVDTDDKHRRKRKRNRTIDYHDLPNGGSDLWCATVSTYSHREFPSTNDVINKVSSNSDTETEGLGHGLGLIIDKLKNIETKLDELKTMDQSVWQPQLPEDGLSDSTIFDEFIRSKIFDTKSSAKDDCESDDETLVDETEEHCIDFNDNEKEISVMSAPDPSMDNHERSESAMTQTDDPHLVFTESEAEPPDTKNILICSPSPEPEIRPHRNFLRISSVSSASEAGEEEATFSPHGVHLEDDDEEDLSSGRQSRIEELARKMMSKVEQESTSKSQERTRHPSEPTLRPVSLELDTVSERSELEDEDGHEDREESAPPVKSVPPSASRKRTLRTRSASRERSLPKIRYCWRCHQTGHESYDCSVELKPDFWCPRCLETSHWEDNCWVNDKEIFCNICSLVGHLPCVHETRDFRQRKLVIETFGWLAFKDWFREPDFWSWWNCAGFTNVPLYKLMQHRPRIASPDMENM